MIDRIADIIETEIDRGIEARSEAIRWAAWLVMEEFPQATSRDFGDAAVQLGMHKQSARNRWNEAVANLGGETVASMTGH